MRARFFCLTGVMLAAASPLAAQNDQVLIGPAPSWAHPIEPAAVPANPTGALFVRKQEAIVHLDERGEQVFNSHDIKILNSQALEVGNVGLKWNPAAGAPTVHAVRIHRDGAVIDVLAHTHFEILRREDQLEQAKIDGLLTAVLKVPDLRVGDELEVSYTLPTQDPTLGAQSFGIIAANPGPIPGRFHLALDWTKGQEPKVQLTPDLDRFVTRGASGIDIRLDDPPMLSAPKDAPPRYNWQRVAEFSDFASWPAVSQRFDQLFARATQVPPESPLHKEAARIAAAHADKLGRAQSALELVQQQVRYIYVGLGGGNFQPATADETWSRRYGDCKAKTALLLALLRELGVDAEAVLVNSAGADDGFDARLPNPALFDHVLVRATIDGKRYWLDGTLPEVARADTEPYMPFRWVLPLAQSGQTLEHIAWKREAVPDYVEVFKIDAHAGFDAPAQIVQTMVQRGPKGLVEYLQLSSATKGQLEAAFRSKLSGSSTWNTIDSVDYHYDPASHASILTIAGTGPINWEKAAAERSLSLPGGGFFPPDRRQRAADQDQKAPFYDEPNYSCHVTTVKLPAGTAANDWSFNSSIDSLLYNHVYFRGWDRVGDTVRMVRGSRTEDIETSPEKAQRDNARLAAFDNSMAWLYYKPGTKAVAAKAAAAPPKDWATDWTSPAARCLPADLLS